MRVLLVEDNAPLREALAKRLRSDGILPLDRWFGTLHDGSEESFNKMRARLTKKNHKKIQAKTQA